jgi:hypothetical protein
MCSFQDWRICRSVEVNGEYYCVGFNVLEEPEPVCGNGTKEKGEQCDGQDGVLYGQICTDQCTLDCDPNVNLVLNGDFENPVVGHSAKWNIFPDGTPGLEWTVQWISSFLDAPEPANAELHKGVNGWLPFKGNQYAELDSDWDGPGGGINGEQASVSLSQYLNTVPGRDYSVSFAFSPRPGKDETENKLKFRWDGNAIDTISRTGVGNSNTDWSEHEYEINASSYLSHIHFEDHGIPNSEGTFLDDVQVYCKVEQEPEPEVVTIIAHKIVCEDESYLSNWGTVKNDGNPITADTAQNFLTTVNAQAQREVCWLEPGWNFQWAQHNVIKPDNNVYDAGCTWNTFGPTDSNGKAETTVTEITGNHLWMREMLKEGYISFSGTTGSPHNDVSAEIYCHTDVLNYDNYDRIDGATLGKTYYCVAFNAPIAPVCDDVVVVSNEEDDVYEVGSFENGFLGWIKKAVATFVHKAWTSIQGATWIWKTEYVENPTEDETYGFMKEFSIYGTVSSAALQVAADNSYKVWINDCFYEESLIEDNYSQEDTYIVSESCLKDTGNVIKFKVKNWAGNSDPEKNPAGLLYRLDIERDTCYEPENDVCYDPGIILPEEGETICKGDPLNLKAKDIEASDGIVQWAVRYGTCNPGQNTVAGNVDGFNDDYDWIEGIFTSELDTSEWIDEGDYCFVFNPKNGGRYTRWFNIETCHEPEPEPVCGDDIKEGNEECDGEDGVTLGENFCTSACKLIPIYNGNHSCPRGTQPGDDPVQSIEIFSTNTVGEVINLNTGTYLFKASGEYQFGNNSNRKADAGYGTENNWSSLRGDLGIIEGAAHRGVLSLLSDMGTGVMGIVDWGKYNEDHIYYKAYEVDEGDVTFVISDWYGEWYNSSYNNQNAMSDNSGSLTLDVYQCIQDESNSGSNSGETSTEGGFPGGFAVTSQGTGGQVLGEAVELECGMYLFEHIKFGGNNNPEEVKKLQTFLNEHMGMNLAVDGFYGESTRQAVNAFQLMYKEEILGPWVNAGIHCDINDPTGYVYKTTKRWINLIKCPTLNIPMPDFSSYAKADCSLVYSQDGQVLGEETVWPEDREDTEDTEESEDQDQLSEDLELLTEAEETEEEEKKPSSLIAILIAALVFVGGLVFFLSRKVRTV